MDSGNSGSMQSSSGGDEEYDSRSESISAFFNSSNHGGTTMSNAPPAPSQQHNPSMFDSLSNYLDPFQRSPQHLNSNMNPLLNLDSAWSRGPSSEPNCSEPQIPTLGSTGGPFRNNPSMLLSDNGVRATAASADQPAGPIPRNPKKRSRASRRAPTTVLTTDTTNFRAMVQEFTGIPAPPFSASPFPRGGRLDLFGTSLRTGLADPLQPPYLLRPFAQKLQRSSALASLPLSSPSAMVDSSAANAVLSNANGNAFQLPSDLGLPKHNQNLLNMQNSILALQSLLQASPAPKYPVSNLPLFGGKSQGQTTNPMLNEFAASRGSSMGMQLGSLPNLSASDAMSLRSAGNPSTWGEGVVGPNDGDQGHLKSFGGNSQQRVSSCKLNFANSSSDLQSEKGAENGSSRGEGMVDSWICSSE